MFGTLWKIVTFLYVKFPILRNCYRTNFVTTLPSSSRSPPPPTQHSPTPKAIFLFHPGFLSNKSCLLYRAGSFAPNCRVHWFSHRKKWRTWTHVCAWKLLASCYFLFLFYLIPALTIFIACFRLPPAPALTICAACFESHSCQRMPTSFFARTLSHSSTSSSRWVTTYS